MTDDIDAIARGLSAEERRAVMGKTRWLSYAQALAWPMIGTVERMKETPHKWQATDLGLRLRQHLEENSR